MSGSSLTTSAQPLVWTDLCDDARRVILELGANPSTTPMDFADESQNNKAKIKNFFRFVSSWNGTCRDMRSDLDDAFFSKNLTYLGQPVESKNKAFELSMGIFTAEIERYFSDYLPVKELMGKIDLEPQYFVPLFAFAITLCLLPLPTLVASMGCLTPLLSSTFIITMVAFFLKLILGGLNNSLNIGIWAGSATRLLLSWENCLSWINLVKIERTYPLLSSLSMQVAPFIPMIAIGVPILCLLYYFVKTLRASAHNNYLISPWRNNDLAMFKQLLALIVSVGLFWNRSIPTVAALLLWTTISALHLALIGSIGLIVAFAITKLISYYNQTTSTPKHLAILTSLTLIGSAIHAIIPFLQKASLISNYSSPLINLEIFKVTGPFFLGVTLLNFVLASNLYLLKHSLRLIRAKYNTPSYKHVKKKLIAYMPYARQNYEKLKQLESANNTALAKELKQGFWFKALFYLNHLDDPQCTIQTTKNDIETYKDSVSFTQDLQYQKILCKIEALLDQYDPQGKK